MSKDRREGDQPLWQKYIIGAAIEYMNDRSIKPGIIVDNSILKDGVLESRQLDGRSEFVICVAPGFVTYMEYNTTGLSITAKFDYLEHSMEIPYHAVRAVVGIGVGGLACEDGHTNVIPVPPIIYPPGDDDPDRPVSPEPIEIDTIELQPAQEDILSRMGVDDAYR